MRKTLIKLLNSIFGLLVLIALSIGAVVAFMFALGFVTGGPAAAQLALTGKKFLVYAIEIAAVGVLSGLLSLYAGGTHELTLSDDHGEEDGADKPA